MRRALLVGSLALCCAAAAQAQQTGACTVGSLTTAKEGYRGWPNLPSKIAFVNPEGITMAKVQEAANTWTNGCADVAGSMPSFTFGGNSAALVLGGHEVWTVKRGPAATIGIPNNLDGSEGACAHADYFGTDNSPGKVIRIATDRSWNCDHALAHEIGHVLRLANALDEADKPCGTSIMGPGGSGPVTEDLCRKVKEEIDRPDGGGGDGDPTRPGVDDNDCDINPGPNCPPNCLLNPFHSDCPPDCSVNPADPRCPKIQTCPPEVAAFTDLCPTYAFSKTPGGGSQRLTNVSAKKTFLFGINKPAKVKIRLTRMSADFDCRVKASGATTGTGNPPARAVTTHQCTNNASTMNDSWEGDLPAGNHKAVVVPPKWSGWVRNGNYTISITAKANSQTYPPAATPDPPPPPPPPPKPNPPPVALPPPPTPPPPPRLTPPEAPVATGQVSVKTHTISWTAPTSHKPITRYQLEAKRTGGTWATPTGGSATSSNLSATTRSWNIETSYSTVQHYRVRATNADGDGTWSNEVTLTSVDPPIPPPAKVSITGTVVRQTQKVTWTAPTSRRAITKYQLETRNDASSPWRWPGGGSPSPASAIPATARSWSVTTSAGTHRHYRVRAVSSAGNGDWSDHVELTSASPPPPPPPPPPLTLPPIPNFNGLPSGRAVNTTFPVATGGVTPYRYSVTGLPPGVSFNATTRVASGTLPFVSQTTTYSITYKVADSASATATSAFTATVVPPPVSTAPTLTGSVTGTTQNLSWSAPTSSAPITGYRLEVRNTATSSWRCTNAGRSSCSLAASKTSWSVNTAAGLTRRYRLRASNAGGHSLWSDEVVLTSGGGGGGDD